MDEETIKKLETQFASLAGATKPNLAAQKVMEEMNRTMAKMPKFERPSITRPEFTLPYIPPTQQEINYYQSP